MKKRLIKEIKNTIDIGNNSPFRVKNSTNSIKNNIRKKLNSSTVIIACTIVVLLTGCSDISHSRQTSLAPTVNDVLQQGMANEDQNNSSGQDASKLDFSNQNSADQYSSTDQTGTDSSGRFSTQSPNDTSNGRQTGVNDGAPAPEEISESEILSTEEGIDIDLTTLSATVVYSEVYDMMMMPDEYIGKTIKMGGTYSSFYDEASDKYYFACIIMDATACCAQGIEFVLTDDYVYPDDYPQEDDPICVVGVFDSYVEDGYTYYTLRNAKFVDE